VRYETYKRLYSFIKILNETVEADFDRVKVREPGVVRKQNPKPPGGIVFGDQSPVWP
jgi:hypothetical protein